MYTRKIGLNIGSFTVQVTSTKNTCWINCDILDLREYSKENKYNFQQFDATKGIPYKDNEVDLIIASHFMEHITRQEGTQFLKECFRVIKPQGIIRLTVPDTKLIAGQYFNIPNNFKTLFRENEGVKNSEDVVEAYWNFITAGHKTAYDEDSLGRKMKEAGFVEVRSTMPNQSRSEEIRVETKDMFQDHSVYMEGIKPPIYFKGCDDPNSGSGSTPLKLEVEKEPYQQYLLGNINSGRQ